MVWKFKTKTLKLFSIVLVLYILLFLTTGCIINYTNTQLFVYCEDGLYRISSSVAGKPQKEKILSTEIELEGEKEDIPFALPIWNSPYFFFPKKINQSFTSQLCYPSISNDGEKIIGFSGKRIADCLDIVSWIEKTGSNKKFMLDQIFNESIYDRNYCVFDAWFAPAKNEIFYLIYDDVYEEDGDINKIELWKTDLDLKNKVGLTEDLGSLDYSGRNFLLLYPPIILSPDGEKILFYIGDQLWIMNSDGTGKRNISEEMGKEIGKNEPELEVYVHGLQANFTPDSKKIIMFLEVSWQEEESDWEDNEYELWIMDIDGLNKKKLLGESEKFTLSSFIPFLLTPDGKKIIFYGVYSESGKEDDARGDIWIINIDGTDMKNLTASFEKEPETNSLSIEFMPYINISPDGEKIIFEFAYYHLTKGEMGFSLGIANTDGSGTRDILKEAKEKYPELKEVPTHAGPFFYPCFTPDSKNVVFISYGGPYLWIISEDGKNIVNLSKTCDLKIWSGFIESFIPGG